MNCKGLVLAEAVMLVGLGIALLGGVGILVVSSRGPIDGLIGLGVGSTLLIYLSGRQPSVS